MHSRIFELTPTRLMKGEQLSEPKLEGIAAEIRGSLPVHMDYFQELKQDGRAYSIQWLREFLDEKKEFCTFDEKIETIVFHKGFRNAFFAHRFEELKQHVEKLTLDQFSEEDDTLAGGLSVYRLKKMVETTDGFYVFGEGGYLQTLDTFVRELQYETTYYIGGILDYHS